MYGSQRLVQVSAGAEWLQKRRHKWVRAYELRKVMAHSWINTIYLDLADEGGRKMKIRGDDLQEDCYLWDLVYNAIVHSVILGGARTNALLHRAFEVPRPRNSTGANGADGNVSLGSKGRENAPYVLHTGTTGRRSLVKSRGSAIRVRPRFGGPR